MSWLLIKSGTQERRMTTTASRANRSRLVEPDLLKKIVKRLPPISRRYFLAQTTALAAASTLPLGSIAQGTMLTRAIPGTDERLPVIGLGAPRLYCETPPEGDELAKSLVQAMVDMGGRVMDTPVFFRPDPPVIGPILNEMARTSARRLWTATRSGYARTHVRAFLFLVIAFTAV